MPASFNTGPGNGQPGGGEDSRRGLLLAVAMVMAVAGLVRLVNLGGPDLWEDEIYTYIGSTDLIGKHLMWAGERTYPHAPLAYIECKIVRQFLGNSPWAIRLPAALWGTLAAGLLCLIVSRQSSAKVGLAAGLMLALHPFSVEWGRDGRMYAQWLFFAVALVGLAMSAWQDARRSTASPVNWHYWFMGMLFGLMHGYAVHGVTTIAAVLAWLVVMAAMEWPGNRRGAIALAGGAAVASITYLSSWALSGVGDILLRMSSGGNSGKTFSWGETLKEIVFSFSGYLNHWLAWILILAAVAGLVMRFIKGEWRFVLLTLFIGLMPLVAAPFLSAKSFFTARYATVLVIPVCVGLGALLAWIADWTAIPSRNVRRSLAAGVGALILLAWSPALMRIITLPRVAMGVAIAPIRANAAKGDGLICVPEWYTELGAYYPFGNKVSKLLPPGESMVFLKAVDEKHPLPKRYDADFEDVIGARRKAGSELPPAVWLFLVDPGSPDTVKKISPGLDRLLEAYDITDAQELAKFHRLCADNPATLTLRISKGKVDAEHAVMTHGRMDGMGY